MRAENKCLRTCLTFLNHFSVGHSTMRLTRCLLSVIALCGLLVQIPGYSIPKPPMLPPRFYNDFTITYTPRDDPGMPQPPWIDGIPPVLPYSVGRGYTVYAPDLGIMVENYTDYCVPIFWPNAYFSCVMFNYNNTAYLISPAKNGYGPCCVYRTNWNPPRRDFMQQFGKYYQGSTENLGIRRDVLKQKIDWWVIPQPNDFNASETTPDSHPVFGGFGFARKTLPSGYHPYVTFWYEGDIGWTHQIFENFTDEGPKIHLYDNFELPEICRTDLACLFT